MTNAPNHSPRILIVRVGAMGDVLHGMPAVAALHEHIPNAYIGWAIEPHWSPLLRSDSFAVPRSESMPMVDRVHEVPTREWSRHPLSLATLASIRRLRQELRAEKYDIAIDLQGSIRSSVIARMSGAKTIVGNAAPRERQARWLYTQCVQPTQANVVDQAAEIVSTAIHQPLQVAKVTLPTFTAEQQWRDDLLHTLPQGPLVFLAPTAGWGAKQWPAERFGELARRLSDHGCNVLVNAQPEGIDRVAKAVVSASQSRGRAVSCTMPQLLELVQCCDLVIAGDTGPLHLAAAVSVPALGLYGPTDPARNGPWGTRSRVLRHPSSRTDYRRHPEVERGLAAITVDEVFAQAIEMLGRWLS